MWKLVLLFIVLAASGCNLSTSGTLEATYTPRAEETLSSQPVQTATTFNLPTPLPLSGSPAAATPVPVTSVPLIEGNCRVYVTYSGAVASNKLSLRAEPSTDAVQLFRVPNNTQVLLVPGSAEILAEDYHWLNVIYTDSNTTRYQGWMARDSFAKDGVRDPSIATLRTTDQQAPC